MAFANDKPRNSITWPAGAQSGSTRIVVGADTPAILVAYGIQVAILFYVQDAQSGLEVGYFFIGSSNILDASANDNVMLMGHVIYPTPGNPNSATVLDVKTHFQINMDQGEENPPGPITKFKDYPVRVNSTVPQWTFGNPITTVDGTNFDVTADAEFTGDVDILGSSLVIGADRSFSGHPIGWEETLIKGTDQGTSQVNPVQEFEQDLFWVGLPAGLYVIDYYLAMAGPAAAAGVCARIETLLQTVGTLTRQVKMWHTGPPDTTVSANLNRASQDTQSNRQNPSTILRYGVINQQVSASFRCILEFSTNANEIYLKFMRASAAAPAGDVTIQGMSHATIKRWA